MHTILVIRLYFPLDALHVSDCISPSSGATFIGCTSHLVYAGICRFHTSGCCVAIATLHLIEVAPDDGLIQSETCRASNLTIKSNHKNFVHLLVYIHLVR